MQKGLTIKLAVNQLIKHNFGTVLKKYVNNIPLALLFLFFVSGIFTQSCKREQLDNSPSAKLGFSTDTVMFDTVFTVHGGGPFPRSVNQRLQVYNRNKNTVKTTIRLVGGNASPYRINIDGQRTTQVTDYEIMGKDSIYIFVEVSIDPLNGSDPIIRDSIEFITNGNVQYIQLRAFGIDAYYFNKATNSSDTAWMDPNKPYVIYGYYDVAEGKKLTIGPGVKVYADVGAYLFVEGTLEVQGNAASKNNRVSFQGARLGSDFTAIPGQWGGIWFATTSVNNSIRFADIMNGTVGVRSDSLPKSGAYKVTIDNTLIKNMSAVGVLGFTSKIKMVNSCVGNCGQYTFAGDLGGQYEFLHCTFANYGGTFARKEPSFALSNSNYKDPSGAIYANPLTFSVVNTIIYGSLKEELLIVKEGQGAVTITGFDNNILRTQIQGLPGTGNIFNQDPKFKDVNLQDFKLDTLSPAHNALTTALVFNDLEGTLRDANPDIGAYERVE